MNNDLEFDEYILSIGIALSNPSTMYSIFLHTEQ